MKKKVHTFKKTRHEHRNETAEDYVEVIYNLIEQYGEARLTDVANKFGVTPVTAHKVISRLQRDKLITTEPYRAIFLTTAGKKLALTSQARHQLVYQFLKQMGVPDDIAQADAEGIEHHVSPETMAIFKKHLRR